VGTGEAQVDFLEIEGLARNVHARETDDDHAALLAGEVAGELDRLIRGAGGGDDRRVEAEALGEEERLRLEGFIGGKRRDVAAELAGELELRGIDVDAEDAAAGGAEQLDGEQAEETEPDDGDPLADLGGSLADALQRDGPDRGAGGVIEAHAVGHADREVAGNADDFGVIGG